MRAGPRIAIAIAVAAGIAITIWLAISSGGGNPRERVSTGDVITGRADAEKRLAEVQAARDRADEEAKRAKRLAAIPQMFGARPGQPGPLLAGVPFAFEDSLPNDARERIGDFEIATDAQVRTYSRSSPYVDVIFFDDAGVIEALTRAWGPIPAGGKWIDEPDRLSVGLFHDGHTVDVSWSAFQTVDDLFAPHDPDRFGFDPPSQPLLGAKQDAVRAIMHAGDMVSDRELSMTIPALAGSEARVDVTFSLDGSGTVTSLEIGTNAPQAHDAVRAALARKYGAPISPWAHGRATITLASTASGDTIRVERR